MSAHARPVLVFATHNPHKVREIQEMLADRYEVKSLTDIGCHEDIVEDADTLEGNARIKALHVVKHYGLDCFADDTGLEVEALDGAPACSAPATPERMGTRRPTWPSCSVSSNALSRRATRRVRRSSRTSICLVQQGQERLIEGSVGAALNANNPGPKASGTTPCSPLKATR